ncbi:MAG TPA: amidohydrolase [Bryobacteraceae bacterium]|nr:amidohydrolase [Bryobacteraceae bacterium]
MRGKRNRREFFGITGAAIAGALGRPWLALAAEGDGSADLVVTNAKVYTVDSRLPRAQAFAIKGGRFLAIGTTDEMRPFIGKSTQTYDAKGLTIVPGFIDCHNHAPGVTLLYDVIVGNPYEVEFVTIDSIVDKLKARAAKVPPGTWVEGYFFDDTKVKDNRELNVHDLDKVSTDHPVVVQHRGGHTSYYNSKALEMADINKNTPNPPGGTYDKFPDGSLNGRVTDRARTPFQRVGKHETFSPAQTAQRNREGIAFISKQFAKYGVTSVHHEGGDLNAIQEVRARGDLLHRVSYEANGRMLDAMIANGIETGFGDEWVRFGATSEHTVDGSFSERTMAISKPYIGITPPYQGNVTETQKDLDEWAEKTHRAGIQLNCHANGDVAIDMTLTAYEKALKAFPRKDARPKITHCSLCNPDIVRRMKAMDCVPAAFTTYAYYNSDKFHFYGEEMMKWMMPYRSWLDAGIVAAAGSDFSPGPFDPRMAIQGMATRKGWNGEVWGANQKITIEEALRVNTLNGAYNSHEENIKGSITPGKLADYVVLSDDLFTVDVEKIKDLKIVRTVVGGRTVYEG